MENKTNETIQESFWKSKEGDAYVDRNTTTRVDIREKLWKEVLKSTSEVQTILEFGCNIGLNLIEIHKINKNIELSGVEINEKAAKIASSTGFIKVDKTSILSYNPEKQYDLCIFCGVLIHINPKYLDQVYSILNKSASKYILINENYSKRPRTLKYHNRHDLRFTRDYAKEFIENYPDWETINQGDYYKQKGLLRLVQPHQDIKWFLLKRKGHS